MDNYIKALCKIYSSEITLEEIKRDYENFTLTENIGKNNHIYLWYKDEAKDICIDTQTLELLSDSEINEQLL